MKKAVENIYLVLIFLFLFLPIAVLILFSFNTSSLNIVFEGFTVHWYKDLLQNRTLLEALFNTLIVAGVSTIVSTIIGTISAYGYFFVVSLYFVKIRVGNGYINFVSYLFLYSFCHY